MCNIFQAPVLKCELTNLPVGSGFGAGGSTGISSLPHHYCSILESGALQLGDISVVYVLTTTTDWVLSADLLSAWVVNAVANLPISKFFLMKTQCHAITT